MRWQTTAVLAVLLIALGAFYYVFEVRLGPGREEAEARKGRVFSVENKDVTALRMKRPADTVALKREGDDWRLLEPVAARADRAKVEEAITALATTRSDREIEAAPRALADFGLDKPSAEVTVTLKDGKTLGLVLGARTPTGAWVYAREAGKAPVFTTSDSVQRLVTAPVADFRDKTILAFDGASVSGLDVTVGGETLALEHGATAWSITRPLARPADGDSISDFLSKLGAARIKEFVAEAPPSLTAWGLDKPVRVTLVTGKDKDRTTKTLLLGKQDTASKGVYAMREGEGSVFLVPEEVWTALPKNVAAARSKALVEVDRDKVTGVDLESPRGRVTLVRENDRWKITAPEALPADQVEAGGLLFKLRELKAQGFLSEDASGIPRYLARPEVRVTVRLKDGAPPVTVLLAPSPEKRGGETSAYAAVAGRGPVVLVDGKTMAGLEKSLNDLRDRTLLSGLEPKDVNRITVKAAGKTTVVERKDATDWRMVEPKKSAAAGGKVDDLLYALRALRWKEIVAPDGAGAAKYGLQAPAAEVTLARKDGTAIATLLLGGTDGERRYVKLQATAPIYAVDTRQVEGVEKLAADAKS
ncbi:MAG: DUF4340 domain-containing protein [Candidatus Rokubacteria bacterium]|nr:DUF4340 domain-containing protein [Candidatus Rokubacteria bacterium]